MFLEINKKFLKQLDIPKKNLSNPDDIEMFEVFDDLYFDWKLQVSAVDDCEWGVAKNEMGALIVFPLNENKRILDDFSFALQVLFNQFQFEEREQNDYLRRLKECKVIFSNTRQPISATSWNRQCRKLISEACEKLVDPVERIVAVNHHLVETGRSMLPFYFREIKRFYALYFDGRKGEYSRYLLEVALHLDDEKVVREVEVPGSLTFEDLHHVIQTVFNWDNAHLHEFSVPENPKDVAKPYAKSFLKVKMQMDDEFDDPFADMDFLFEDITFVSQLFRDFSDIQYVYDFGDGWFHTIKVKKVFQSRKNYPELLSKSGLRPPEDIGGIPGYEIFKQAIRDLENGSYDIEEYEGYGYGSEEDFSAWVEDWKKLDFSIDTTNVLLRRIQANPIFLSKEDDIRL